MRGPPIGRIIAHGLKDEETALRIEGAVIDSLGLPSLTNRVHGWRTIQFGRTPLRQVVAHYRKKRVDVKEPAVLIRINRLYRPTMSATELWEFVGRLAEDRIRRRYVDRFVGHLFPPGAQNPIAYLNVR